MVTRVLRLTFLTLLLSAFTSVAVTRYVDVNNAHPSPPYTNWVTAATVIQNAIDAANPGDEVVVTNGVYITGGRSLAGTMTNRVTVDKPLAVRSVNGPLTTIIRGYQVPGTTNGDGAIRCVYLADGATLTGFTMTGGATRLSGDTSEERSGGGLWCESTDAQVSNCIIRGNAAYDAAGAYRGTLRNCVINGNAAAFTGGGTELSTLINCTVTGNSAVYTGGSHYGLMNNCIIYFNKASLSDNNYNQRALGFGSILNHCCTAPLPTNGVGNFSADPKLASLSHLSAESPCRQTGSAAYAAGADIDGEPWASPPSIGCDEYRAGSVTGGLDVAIHASYLSVAKDLEVNFEADIQGPTTASVWDFGDGTVVSNQPYASHAWAVPADYPVVLRAYNDTWPDGVSATVTVHVAEPPVYHVVAGGINPVPPYNSWTTAATNIQDAVDAASLPGATILVSNGVYAIGGRSLDGAMTNRLLVDKPLRLLSVNGPKFTVIRGHQVAGTTNGEGAVRCVYLAEGASLSGFTLTSGATLSSGDYFADLSGGGVWCESSRSQISNCVVSGNSAFGVGGGTIRGTLQGCTLSGNAAGDQGGGAYYGTVEDCVFAGNSAFRGGGSFGGTLQNCNLTNNAAAHNGGGAYGGSLNDCMLTSNSSGWDGGGSYGAVLTNCVLTSNSADADGGGVCEPNSFQGVITHCAFNANSAGLSGGGAAHSTLDHCTFDSNSAFSGGGAFQATLSDCTLTGNAADEGGGAEGSTLNRCLLTGNTADGDGGAVEDCTLNECTLNANSATWNGGAASWSTLNDCTLNMNSATNHGGGTDSCGLNGCHLMNNSAGGNGGGAYNGTLTNSTVAGNIAGGNGGGTYYSTAVNCTIVGNSAGSSGGGTAYGSLYNSIIYFNSCGESTGFNTLLNTMAGCWTTPGGAADLDPNPPRFRDTNTWSDLHLQSDSPCINSGANAFITATNDLEGNPRIVGGIVDIGAYEFQSPQSVMPYDWLLKYNLANDGSADFADPDGDGLNNWQEWKAGTIPTNALSVLRMLPPEPGTNGVVVRWRSVSWRSYRLERTTNLNTPFVPLQSKIPGQPDVTTYTDTNALGSEPLYYRVGVPN